MELVFTWLGVNFLFSFLQVIELNNHPEIPFEDNKVNLLDKFMMYTFLLPSTYFWKFLDSHLTMVVKKWYSLETIRKFKELREIQGSKEELSEKEKRNRIKELKRMDSMELKRSFSLEE